MYPRNSNTRRLRRQTKTTSDTDHRFRLGEHFRFVTSKRFGHDWILGSRLGLVFFLLLTGVVARNEHLGDCFRKLLDGILCQTRVWFGKGTLAAHSRSENDFWFVQYFSSVGFLLLFFFLLNLVLGNARVGIHLSNVGFLEDRGTFLGVDLHRDGLFG